MASFSGDWTALEKRTRVIPYLRGEPYDGEVWRLASTPHDEDVAEIEREGIPMREVRRSNGWELSRA